MYYILIIILCVCVEGWGVGGILKKTKMHTTGISNMGSFSHTCQKEHPRRNGNFRDSIIFRKHCVWLEFAWCTRYDICHIQTAQSNLLHYYLSCFPFQIVRFYKTWMLTLSDYTQRSVFWISDFSFLDFSVSVATSSKLTLKPFTVKII